MVDVQHAAHPDLHGYRRHHHLAILLDEVADPSFIVNNKKVLQAHVDGALLGQSATQMFVYEVFLWRTPIILTTNNWNLSGLAEDELEWINANCVVVHIAEPVYAHSSETQTPRQTAPGPQLAPISPVAHTSLAADARRQQEQQEQQEEQQQPLQQMEPQQPCQVLQPVPPGPRSRHARKRPAAATGKRARLA